MCFPSKSSELLLAHVAIFALITLPPLAAQAQNALADAPNQDTHGIVVANLDASVKPGEDFNEYANGGWIKRTEIPPDRGNIGVFTALADLSNKRTVALIEEAAKANAPAVRLATLLTRADCGQVDRPDRTANGGRASEPRAVA